MNEFEALVLLDVCALSVVVGVMVSVPAKDDAVKRSADSSGKMRRFMVPPEPTAAPGQGFHGASENCFFLNWLECRF